MKLLLVSHAAELYGAARSLLTLAQGLQARGHILHVVVPEGGPLESALHESGIDTTEIKAPSWALPPDTSLKARQWYLRRIVWASRQIVGVIRQFEPDLIHTNSAIIPSGALAARWTGVPHVWHIREQVVEHYDQRFLLGRQVSLSLMGTLSAAMIAISRSTVAAYTAPATAHKLFVVYNGVELPPAAGARVVSQGQGDGEATEPVLALVGVLHPGKGQDEAIRALAILRGHGLTCRLMLIGGDPVGYGPTLAALAAQMNVASQVTFIGHLPDPLVEMAKADVVLMCSRSEAFGRVTVEAMLLGKPVIGANAGGTPEIIEEGRTGLLYRHGDPAHLADRIAELLADPAEAARLGVAARQAALSRFSVAQYVDGVEAVYRSVLANEAILST